MMNLAAATLLVSGITGLIMAVILFTVAKSYPQNIQGIADWANAILLASMSMFLLLGRGLLPDFLSIVVANLILFIAFIQINSATRLLCDSKPWIVGIKRWLILTSFVMLYGWFTYVSPSMPIRVVLLGVFVIPIVAEQFIFSWRNLDASSAKTILLVSLGLVIFGRGLRAISVVYFGESPSQLFENSIPNILSLALPALTIPLSTVSCIMVASEKLHRSLEHASRHDDLTDLLNKKTITEILEQEIKRTKRLKNNLSIMLLDLDDFKNINDQYGHLMGDKVLINFAKKSKTLFRDSDHLARFGGDEFIAVLPDTSTQQANLIAERINKAGAANDPTWSVSIGIAEFIDNDSFETILMRADNALYEAKSQGKNQSHIAQRLDTAKDSSDELVSS